MNVLFRTDSGRVQGAGHFYRCLALAQQLLEDNHKVAFVLNTGQTDFAQRAAQEGLEVFHSRYKFGSSPDAALTRTLARDFGALWVVIDGYGAQRDYIQTLRDGLWIMVVDDIGDPITSAADLILNQNLHAVPHMYSDVCTDRLLLGPKYQLLRREFRIVREQSLLRDRSAIKQVLISFGGTDPNRLTSKFVQRLTYTDLDVDFTTVGGELSAMRRLLRRDGRFRILQNVSDMGRLMMQADFLITAGGSTVWEAAALGLPIVGLARGLQEEVLLEAAQRLGMCASAHTVDEVVDILLDTVRSGWILSRLMQPGWFDGLGPKRIATFLQEHVNDRSI